VSQRHNSRHRRWTEKPFAYRRAIEKRARKSLKRDKGYLYVDWAGVHPYHFIWAHELDLPVLIHKGRKP
jgi:hypothetical protein